MSNAEKAASEESEFTEKEMFQYASGDLSPERMKQIEEAQRKDPELAAQLQFFRLFNPGK